MSLIAIVIVIVQCLVEGGSSRSKRERGIEEIPQGRAEGEGQKGKGRGHSPQYKNEGKSNNFYSKSFLFSLSIVLLFFIYFNRFRCGGGGLSSDYVNNISRWDITIDIMIDNDLRSCRCRCRHADHKRSGLAFAFLPQARSRS